MNYCKLLFIKAFFLLPLSIFSQEIGQIYSLEQLNKYVEANKKEKTYHYVSLDNATWNDIPIKDVTLDETIIKFKSDSEKEYSTKKIVDYLSSTFGKQMIIEEEYFERTYTINTPDYNIELTVDIDEKETIKKSTESSMKIKYKKQYAESLPSLSRSIAKNPDGAIYYLDVKSFNCSYDIY